MVPTARLISNRQELKEFFDKINRPDTKWRVVNISIITFYVYHLKDVPLDTQVHC